MMGYRKVWLLLLLSSCALAQGGSQQECLLASRFKAYKKYAYQYTTESRNTAGDSSALINGPKISCQVEIEVPQTCRFILHIRNCELSEISGSDPHGLPVYSQSPDSEAFNTAVGKNPLKFTAKDATHVHLYPEREEQVNILNFKRGIISALVVPEIEGEQNSPVRTVHGLCLTDIVVNVMKDIPTDVTLSRELSQCDQYHTREPAHSPLALLQKLHLPLSKLMRGTQDCNYQFDNKGKHIVTVMCTEKHMYLPFVSEGDGPSSAVTQTLSYQSSKKINNREFAVNPSESRPLYFEDPDDKTSTQTKDAVLSTLQELQDLADTDQGQKRPNHFHKLVSSLRVLKNETLSQMVDEMLDRSPWLTWQGLLQCGTLECTSAILQAIRTIDGVSVEVDALVYWLSLQANPNKAHVRDMLSMAQYKQSKAIMYALANTVKKFHKGEVTAEVTEVSAFMETLLDGCSGEDPDSDFLVLRVVGVMGQAMQAVSPSLISSILKCAKRRDIPLSNQKAAIQALRLMDIKDEMVSVLMEVFQDDQNAVERRIAAYLTLMKSPHLALLKDIVHILNYVRDDQIRSFVFSHLRTILVSQEPELQPLKEYIESALPPRQEVHEGSSRNYKTESVFGSVQANVIFDEKNTLPKEVMLESTLKAFGYSHDMFEVNVEGSGFEPTIEALFGDGGFFPDSISRIMYWAENNAGVLKDVLGKMAPDKGRMKRQPPQDLLKDITDNIKKLVDALRTSESPEAVAILQLLGNEIGYMKTSEIHTVLETLTKYYQVFFNVLPYKIIMSLIKSTNNKVFAHYIFMENVFSLPTTSGLPLRFSVAGVITAGAKGGLVHSANTGMTHISFQPSVGLEFITQMGVHLPEYLETGLEMQTNVYHESNNNLQVTMNRNQFKLSLPAPKGNIQLFSFSNKLLSVSSGQTVTVPSPGQGRTDSTECQDLFSGLKLCTVLQYSDAKSMDPLTGETRFALEIQPTADITEYTATIEPLRDGKKGPRTADSLRLTLKAEGDDSTEVTATLKYNRNKDVLTADVVIPDYDVEAGIKLAVTDSDSKGKKMRGITIDVTNKNIPQLSLVGRTRLSMMKDAMLQLQMTVPSLNSKASVTATLKDDEEALMEVETVVSLPKTSFKQKSLLRHDADKFEVELTSDLNSDIHKLIPGLEDYNEYLQRLFDDVLDQRVPKTDMKLRHIINKGIEAGNIWLDKFGAHIPYLANLRSKRSVLEFSLPSVPEKLFLQSDSLFRYQFNKERMAISLPVPLGGKNVKDLNIPTTLSLPSVNLNKLGIDIPSKTYSLPPFTIPTTLDFTIPLLGLVEASTKINTNYYLWEGSFVGGNNTVDVPNYIVQYKAMAQSPLKLLSYKLEGTGLISGRAEDNLKYLLNTSFSHCFIDTSFSIIESLRVTNKLNARASYKGEVSSPIGLEAFVFYSAQSTSTLNSDEVSGDGTLDGLLKIGPLYSNVSYSNNYNLRPVERKGKGESTFVFDSPLINLHNRIHGVYANSELNVVSKTNVQRDVLKHVAELKYKDAQLTLKCSALGTVMGKILNNKVEVGVSSKMGIFRIESQADDDTTRAYSIISGTLDGNGLQLSSEGSLILETGRGMHKASFILGKDGLTTGGTNSFQCSPVTLENVFNGAIDKNGATLSSRTKVIADEGRGELNIEGKVTSAEASLEGVLKGHAYGATTRNNLNVLLNRQALTLTCNSMATLKQLRTENSYTMTLTLWTLALGSSTNNVICEDMYYKQDTKVTIKPFIMSFDIMNDLKLNDVDLKNEGHLKVQPNKIGLSGSTKGAFKEEHYLKHTYEISYEDMAGTVQCSTSGTVMDAQISQKCEFEFAGFATKSICEAKINSEPLRFDGALRTMVLPFSVTVDALVNSDGEIKLGGKHTGQLYSKLLVKAEPLALAYSHDSRVSTTHSLSGDQCSTSVENKIDGLLSPADQHLNWKVKSKINNHVYNQDISTYNNPQKVGFEFSGAFLTDLFSKLSTENGLPPEIQEFSTMGFLQYDKNGDCHLVSIPFVDRLPAAFDRVKSTLVKAMESFQQFIKNLDIDQLILDFKAKLKELPKKVRDMMKKIDLDNKVNGIKAKLDYFVNEFSIEVQDLELEMQHFTQNLENTVIDIATKFRDLITTVQQLIKDGDFGMKIREILSKIGDQLQAFDDKYEVKQSLVKVLLALEDILRQIDLQKLTDSSTEWLRELDSKYGIRDKIKDNLSEAKEKIENFDIKKLFQDLSDLFHANDLAKYVEQLYFTIPASDIAHVIESMHDVIVNWIDEYEIPDKFNAVYFYVRDLVLKYNLDGKFKELMDQVVLLIKDFKIEQTVQSAVDALKRVQFEFVYNKMIEFLESIDRHLREIDFKKSIEELNEQMYSTLKSLKDFNYSEFVDKANEKIAELTDYINEQIKKYEIVQKVEAVRDFIRKLQSDIYSYLEQLRNTKIADALKKLADLIGTTFYDDVKLKIQDMLVDMKQRVLDMDVRDEVYIHLQRASESYGNIVTFIRNQFQELKVKIRQIVKDNDTINQILDAIITTLNALKKAEIKIGSFTVPLTDLVVPAFTINLHKLHEMNIPSKFSVPKFTVLNSYTIPAAKIDFEEIKTKAVMLIDYIRRIEINIPDPELIFGDVKVLYLFQLPDVTFPEITLSEITFPTITIPKLNVKDFEITMLPLPEVKLHKLTSDICIPTFGKLNGEFKVNFPQFSLVTTGKIENATSSPKNPQFSASIHSDVKAPFDLLEYTLDATAQLAAPRLKKLLFTETMKATHKAFSVDHEGSVSLTGSSVDSSAKTAAKATTCIYTADLVNNIALSLKGGISATIDTTYNHSLDLALRDTSSQLSLKQHIAAAVESGRISVTGETSGDGKWSILDYSDEGTHRSSLEFKLDSDAARLAFVEETDCKALKSKKTLTIESVNLSHVTVEARCESEILSFKKSLMVLNGEARIGDLKVALTASHDSEFTGCVTGSMSNSLELKAQPFEIVLDFRNKVNSKISLPLKLTGKLDLAHDCGLILNSEKQRATCLALAKFNKYKYQHNITAENNDVEKFFDSSASGEANLDFMTVPLSMPSIKMPYFEISTPEVKDFSLWENAGLKHLLITPQQSFDMNLRLHYYKNPDVHSIEFHLGPVYSAIKDQAVCIQGKFEQWRDRVVSLLKDSYNQAKPQYVKRKVDTPSPPPIIFTVPAYKIPILNIHVSAFRAEMPAFGYFVPKEVNTPSFKIPALGFTVPSYALVLPSLGFPVIHLPEMLSEIELPTVTLPAVQNNVEIPALGNLTYDFSFKSPQFTLSVNAGLYNQTDLVARYGAISSSVFDFLNAKFDGSSALSRSRGTKLSCAWTLKHDNVEANHECTVSLTKRSMEASVSDTVSINLPFLNVEFKHELTGNNNGKPNVASKKKINYMFDFPVFEALGKGTLDTNWELEVLPYQLLLDSSTHGKSDISVMEVYIFAGDLDNKADFYLSANGLRLTVRTVLNSLMNKLEKKKRSTDNGVLEFDVNNSLGLEVSLSRVYATVDYLSKNNVSFPFFSTNGRNSVKGQLEFVPLVTSKMTLDIDANQPSSLGEVGLRQNINLAMSSEKQSLTWTCQEQLSSLVHVCEFLLSNDESEVRMDLTESVQGHLGFLKAVKLPVYQKSLWDVFRFDRVTDKDDLQFLNVSYSIVYMKSMDGQEYSLPYKLLENGISVGVPELRTGAPTWFEKILNSLRHIDMRLEPSDVPDHLTLPPTITIPALDLPFTSLHVEPFTIDLKNIVIPKVITTTAFEILLPGLPVVSVPSYNINTEYLKGNMSFLSLKVPRSDITVSSFTLPKEFTIGPHTVSFKEMTRSLLNFDHPTITIPEQKIEVPNVALHLPLSVFIPTFGTLSTTVKVSSPIYNVSVTSSLEKKNTDLVTSLNSVCTSTMAFLEHDLSASATFGFENGLISVNGQCNLIHNDVNVRCQHALVQNLRTKRQTPPSDLMDSHHTLNVDITSQTFTDINFRFASRKDGLTASVSCPSSGFLALQVQQRPSTQLTAKLFCRYLDSPERETDILITKATLKNSRNLIVQMSWNWDFLHDAIEGTKERVPAVNDAVFKAVNKYHTTHFGFSLNRGGLKLKNALSNIIDKTYSGVLVILNSLQDSVQQLRDEGADMFREASQGLKSFSLQKFIDELEFKVRKAFRISENKMERVLDFGSEFLKEGLFTLPEERIPLLDDVWSNTEAIDRAVRKGVDLLERISKFVREIHFAIPGTEVTVDGKKILKKLESFTEDAFNWLNLSLHRTFQFLRVRVADNLIRVFAEGAEKIVAYVKDKNDDVGSHVVEVYGDLLRSSKRSIEEAKADVVEYKDLTKLNIQKAYNAITAEGVNNSTVEVIDVLQSHLYGGLNEFVDVMRQASEKTAPYIRVSNTKVDMEIPLPFRWRSFSQWPTQ